MEESVKRFTPMGEYSLYVRIGEQDAVEAVVDDFYGSVLDDDLLIGYFEDPAMDYLRAYQIAFVSSVAGELVEYTCEAMHTAHAYLDLAGEDFDAIVSYLETALRENRVRDNDVAAIMTEVAALRDPTERRWLHVSFDQRKVQVSSPATPFSDDIRKWRQSIGREDRIKITSPRSDPTADAEEATVSMIVSPSRHRGWSG